jgi:subtilisin family serine protease
VLLLLFAAAGCAVQSPVQPTTTDATISLDRQILVMIKESALRRYQPGWMFQDPYGATAPPRQERIAHDLARQYEFELISDWPMPALGVRCFLAAVPAAQSREQVASRLASDPRVESVQSVQSFHTLAHNDPYYSLQTSAAALRLDDLHRMAKGRHVTIAQIDSGVELEHPDLRGQLTQPVNFVDGSTYVAESHGTEVAGIIVAKADNGVGIVGVAPEATLMPLRACWQRAPNTSDAMCSSFTLAKAIQYALAHDARVLNLSLAGPPDRLLERLVNKAIEQGVSVIAAIDPNAPDASFPANSRGVIAVATADTLSVAPDEVYAPGERVLTTALNASWAFVSGNSFAAAHVTGIVALLLERAPGLKPTDIIVLLQRHGGRSVAAGRGLSLDACEMLASISAGSDCHCCQPTAKSRMPRSPEDERS